MMLRTINAIAIEKLIDTGKEPLKIRGDDYSSYIIKNTRGLVPAYDVLREFIGGCLLPYWQFSVDEPVLVNVPLRLIEDKQLNAQHLPEYYEVPCFGVPWINGAIDSNKLISLSWVKGSKNRKNKVDI